LKYTIAILKGDGIGPDIVSQALKVLEKMGKIFGDSFEFKYGLIGGVAIDKTGLPLPQSTIDICKKSNAVLLGAVGGPKWDNLPGDKRPEAGLLGIRKALGLFANLRPATLFPSLSDACLLRKDIAKSGIDIMIFRELTGGIYFGKRGYSSDNQVAFDTMSYSVAEIQAIAHLAFKTAQKRNSILTSIDKANVLENSRLWRKTVIEVGKSYKDVKLSSMYVDNAAMQLVRNPAQFDVILTGNMFGDIISDLASMVTGSIGMLPSASLNESNFGMYEPIHGSAPDIAGQNIANPLATILSVAMMFRYTFGQEQKAKVIEQAVQNVLFLGYRTADIFTKGCEKVGTEKMGDLVTENIQGIL